MCFNGAVTEQCRGINSLQIVINFSHSERFGCVSVRRHIMCEKFCGIWANICFLSPQDLGPRHSLDLCACKIKTPYIFDIWLKPSTTGYTRKSGIIYCCTFSVEPSFLVILVNFSRSFSFRSTAISYTDFISLVPPDKKCYVGRNERYEVGVWGKVHGTRFTRREVWADFQDFWSNLTYFCKNHGEFGKWLIPWS